MRHQQTGKICVDSWFSAFENVSKHSLMLLKIIKRYYFSVSAYDVDAFAFLCQSEIFGIKNSPRNLVSESVKIA